MLTYVESLMTLILDVFLNLVLGFLSYIVPKNKKQILLGSNYGFAFMGNPKYFYLHLLNKKNNHFDKFFWITRSQKIYFELKTKQFPVIYLYSLEGFIAILRSNFLIISYTFKDVSYAPLLFGRFNVIQSYHGAPTKGSDRIHKSWNRLIVYYLLRYRKKSYKAFITTSEEAKRQYLDRGFKNIEILGYPRNDVLFYHNYRYENYQSKFYLHRYAKVILYAPTNRDKPTSKIPFSVDFLNKLNDYLSKNNFIFLLRSPLLKEFNFNIDDRSNIIDVSDRVEDVQDLLIYTDIVITDYSSIVMDFVLLNRPIMFYPYDFDEYTETRKLKTSYYVIMPGPFAKNEEELLEIIKSIDLLFKQPEYREKYDQFRTRFNQYKDGKSCDRLYNFLVEGKI